MVVQFIQGDLPQVGLGELWGVVHGGSGGTHESMVGAGPVAGVQV